MDFSSFYDQYSWVGQLILYAVIVYYYLKNRNKKVDEEKVHWYQTVMLISIVLFIMTYCVLGIIYYDDLSKLDQMRWPIVGSSFALLILTSIFIEYKFRRKKNPLNNPPALNQENTP